jgi:tripartite-type tricarboxylate transporter receptor subunit TctC
MFTRLRAMCGAVTILLVALASAMPTHAQAQQWPQRLVKFILPLGAGSGVDIGARLLADRLTVKWGQPVVVENRPGGDGAVAIGAFTSAHDTHILLMSPTSAFVHHPWVMDKLPYDPADLVPIARVSNTVVAVVVPATLKVNSFGELMQMAKAEPGKLNWATITGMFDLVFDAYKKEKGLQIENVPYRNTVQAANDLSEGRIQIMMAAYAIVKPLIEANKLHMIGVSAPARAPMLPDVPTVAESGVPEMVIEGLVGLFGTREVPAEVREKIGADVREALAEPTISARLTATAQIVNPGGPAEFSADIAKQRAQAAHAGQVLGIKPATF